MNGPGRAVPVLMLVLVAASALPSLARQEKDCSRKPGSTQPQRILVLDGSPVHNVGELQIHVSNWGEFGSRPGSPRSYSEAPSAQWPAGSGTEYLYAAGLWVGAFKNGVPLVSTSSPDAEFRPTNDPIDKMYRAAEGDRGGSRQPSATADDDKDGLIDEDWLNGRDDDGDGEIDEDFAAVSKQMFSCWYTDNQPASLAENPTHTPLNLYVRQESYQWEEDRFDDFVGINYWITNIGNDVLEEVYVGFFADCDAGSRTRDNYWEDDATGLYRTTRCEDLGPVSMDIAYTYDVDGDEGQTLGYFGVMFLGHTTDPTGEIAPERVGVTTYANFSGSGVPFAQGGDPTTDYEAYELMSSGRIDRDTQIPRDYRMLLCAGPFAELRPGSTLVFQTAFVAGLGLEGMAQNAAAAQLTYNGAWFNLDGNPTTGIAGRETPIPGPVTDVVVDSCSSGELAAPIDWPYREPLWINNDCAAEEFARRFCAIDPGDTSKYMTGIGGAESQIHWIVGTAPPPPNMRVHDYAEGGVAIYWDNFSETVPDVKTLEPDFEGYRVWRADNWTRPTGTSVLNGPPHDLWRMLFEADVINAFGEDTGMSRYRYEPLIHSLGAARREEMVTVMTHYLTEHPGKTPPCPPGLTAEECDTVQALAAWELGLPEGRQYYRYLDRTVHRGKPYFYSVTALDHAVIREAGLVRFGPGKKGDPSSNFAYVEPGTPAQRLWAYTGDEVYVVPNPATTGSMEPWALGPNNEDPTGIKVEFRNLPATNGSIRVYTLAGDLVTTLPFDGSAGLGTVQWDLVSRNGQDITSGVYLFSVESTGASIGRKVGKFVVIR